MNLFWESHPVSDEPPDPRAESRRAVPDLAGMLSKVASHPCIALIVRQFMRNT